MEFLRFLFLPSMKNNGDESGLNNIIIPISFKKINQCQAACKSSTVTLRCVWGRSEKQAQEMHQLIT